MLRRGDTTSANALPVGRGCFGADNGGMQSVFASVCLVLFASGCGEGGEAEPRELRVAAASSLRELVQETALEFEAAHPGASLRFSFAASSTLARQLEAGASYDVFLSADAECLSRLGTLLEPQQTFLSNRMALVATPRAIAGGSKSSRSGELGELVRELNGGENSWIAIAAPSVPAGRYARELLSGAGLLASLEARFVLGDNERKTLSLVQSGAATLGFVYLSDHRIAGSTELRWSSGAGAPPSIRYFAAVRGGTTEAARGALDYVSWLQSEEFQAAAEARGFSRWRP